MDLGGASLSNMYPPEIMLPVENRWLSWPTQALELLRDVLIFVPVIYTWWQFSRALIAWQRYTGTETFLLAWQDGFPDTSGHSVTQPLSDSAMVVASVVVGVVGLTLLAHVLRSAYNARLQAKQRKLAELLAEASLSLNQSLITAMPDVSKRELAEIGVRISRTAKDLSAALGKSSADIVGAVNANPGSKLHDMFKQWTEMADKWGTTAQELRDLGSRLNSTQEVVNQLRDTQASLVSMQQRIQNETSSLLQAMEQERKQSAQQAFAHDQVAANVGQASKELAESMLGMSERAEDFNGIVLQLRAIINRLDGNGQNDDY
jgi:methyl-accepting chemotaxis protein